MKRAVHTEGAPKAVGPYNQAVVSGGFLWASMQLPLDPATGVLVGEGAAVQLKRVIENLKAVLEAGGSGLDHVVKTTLYLADLAEFREVNFVYAEYFAGIYPARSTLQAGLPLGAAVALDAVARIP